MKHRIKSREEAIANGAKFYFTGQPCPKGHIALRYVSVFACVECHKDILVKKRQATQERKKLRPLSPRQEAQRSGATRYNTGKPCPRGHRAERLTSNGACIECHRENVARREEVNPDIRTKRLRYQKANAERYRTHTRNRRHQLRNAGAHSHKDIEALWTQQAGRCVYCKCRLDDGYHVDHKVAVSKGGSNTKENLQLTCPTCNLRKHNKDHEQFSKSQLIPKR